MFGESIDEAIKRIALNELNLNVKPLKFLGLMEFKSELEYGRYSISLVFLVNKEYGEIKLDYQADDFKFFKLMPENMSYEHKKFLIENNLLKE